ncbi:MULTISPECIES: hypothetical protein [Halobacterium]|uniref:Vng6322h n=4 Tax=Halobacterium salinarum TaxID=2242 RepID=Q9HHM5_HALSA|nr:MULTISPECIES: hypothetical protein [Halobacterium]AAG20953.1 Vng6322h [Halobacterium salinarum NRC-1]MBB6090536.1 hypothetical protein [Halobacterium salinarum]MCF2206771.1 hypothetical protein [Halobacterium salinarum]MCF2240119.1 hypothetical protein [Halobacterium salinarum]MDL0123989.1 hypothetical protein [Halobacterium salinarum]
MVKNTLTDVRNELEEDLRRPLLGYTLLGLTTGISVLATGELLSAAAVPESVVVAGVLLIAGAVPTFTWYVLRKLGL